MRFKETAFAAAALAVFTVGPAHAQRLSDNPDPFYSTRVMDGENICVPEGRKPLSRRSILETRNGLRLLNGIADLGRGLVSRETYATSFTSCDEADVDAALTSLFLHPPENVLSNIRMMAILDALKAACREREILKQQIERHRDERHQRGIGTTSI